MRVPQSRTVSVRLDDHLLAVLERVKEERGSRATLSDIIRELIEERDGEVKTPPALGSISELRGLHIGPKVRIHLAEFPEAGELAALVAGRHDDALAAELTEVRRSLEAAVLLGNSCRLKLSPLAEAFLRNAKNYTVRHLDDPRDRNDGDVTHVVSWPSTISRE